jgi:LacI family transcriptional regulator
MDGKGPRGGTPKPVAESDKPNEANPGKNLRGRGAGKVTIREVAERAGVSAMAVSAVLHGTGRNVKISEGTSETIRRVARELRYQPNRLAQFLRTNRTQTIGVVLQHFDRLSDDNPYFPQVLNGIMSALFPVGYTLALCPQLVRHSPEGMISDGRFDGVLWCRPDFTEASLEDLRHSTTPVVMMHAPSGSAPGVPTFCADNDAAMRTLVKHLVGLGHKKIAYVIEPLNLPMAEGKTRWAAFEAAMREAHLEPELIVWDYDFAGLERYCRTDRPHTAFAAYGDTLAGHLLERCHELGIRVPGDVSVVGFDSSAFCERTSPRLTSINQPVERMAREATQYLLELIERRRNGDTEAPAKMEVYPCPLDLRDSTAPPSCS